MAFHIGGLVQIVARRKDVTDCDFLRNSIGKLRLTIIDGVVLQGWSIKSPMKRKLKAKDQHLKAREPGG